MWTGVAGPSPSSWAFRHRYARGGSANGGERAQMTPPAFDPVVYKAGQRRDWDRAAEGWRKWWMLLEAMLADTGDRLITSAAIQPGQRVLDVATGIGEPALTAAKVVGAHGRVIGTDISPDMLQIARDRAAEAGADNVEFLEMDAEDLQFPEASFDAALCRFGLMFVPNVEAALRGIRRVLAPGGGFAASVWGPPERAPMHSATFGAIARVLELPPPPPGTPGVFALSDVQRLDDLHRTAGFVNVTTEALEVRGTFSSVAEYVAYLKDVGAPIKNLLEGKPPELHEKAWQAVAEANEPFVGPDGKLHLYGEAIIVSART